MSTPTGLERECSIEPAVENLCNYLRMQLCFFLSARQDTATEFGMDLRHCDLEFIPNAKGQRSRSCDTARNVPGCFSVSMTSPRCINIP